MEEAVTGEQRENQAPLGEARDYIASHDYQISAARTLMTEEEMTTELARGLRGWRRVSHPPEAPAG